MSIKDTLVIKAGKWEAGANPRLGANTVYLKYDGKDILCPLESEEQLQANPYIQGAPILLPANRTYLGKFSFEGKDYTLPITEPRTNSHLHGTVHRQCFELLSATETAVVMKYSNTGATYPFDFDITVTYEIDEGGFSQRYEITNTGKCNMPFTFCLHSTFVEPECFILPICSRQEDVRDIPTGRYIPLSEQERRYVTGSPSKGIYVVGYFEASGNVATVGRFDYEVSKNFDHWILYNARGERGFLCLEPQAGKVNGLNMDGGSIILAPGKTEVFTTRYSLSPNPAE